MSALAPKIIQDNLFKLTQVRVDRGMPEHTAHRHDLPLVMKGMSQYMMNHERRGADGKLSVGKSQLRIATDLFIRQSRQIREGPFTNLTM